MDHKNKLMTGYLFDDRILLFLFNVLSSFGIKTDLPIFFQFGSSHSFLLYSVVCSSPLAPPYVQ